MPESILEFIWENYREDHPIDDNWVRQRENRLRPVMEELSMESSNALFGLLLDLSYAYQHAAFMEGIRIGFRLQQELQPKASPV